MMKHGHVWEKKFIFILPVKDLPSIMEAKLPERKFWRCDHDLKRIMQVDHLHKLALKILCDF